MTEYQNLCGKIPEWRHSQSVWILELQLQQRMIQGLHTAAEQGTVRSQTEINRLDCIGETILQASFISRLQLQQFCLQLVVLVTRRLALCLFPVSR